MVTIFAEKPDMGTKFAAALDCITLDDGKIVNFEDIPKYEKAIKKQRARDGFFKINYQGETCYVTWGIGHLVGLKQAKDYNESYAEWSNIPLPYIPDRYELKLITNNTYQYDVVKRLFNKAEYIICATDDDREGDLIFDNIYRYSGCDKPYMRALFNKQSKEEFIKAFDNLVDSTDRENIVSAGRARSIGDFIVGAGPTVAMSLKYPNNGVLSVGRVQTAVLNMITARELEIRNFRSTDYWSINAHFTLDSGEEYDGAYEVEKIDKKEDAEKILAGFQGIDKAVVLNVEQKNERRNKPYLYSLSTLQIDANKKYGFSLDKTANIAQSLYEKGLATYPRVDSVHLTEDMYEEVDAVMEMLKACDEYKDLFPEIIDNYKTKHYFNNNKVSSHAAIIPTKKKPYNLTPDEAKIYDFLAKSIITMTYTEATLSRTNIVTVIGDKKFISQGTTIVDPGFLIIEGVPKDSILPKVKINEKLSFSAKIEKKKTRAPKRYTAASLLSAMKNCGKTIEDEELKKLMANGPNGSPRGLGRPSSQASIVQTLEQRGYTTEKNKMIYPTKKGMDMIKAFPVEELKSAEMTAQWEKRLDDIEQGKETFENFISDLEESVRRWTNQIMLIEVDNDLASDGKEISIKCPICKKPLRKNNKGFGCTGYKDNTCDFFMTNTIKGVIIPDAQIKKLLEWGKTDIIKGFTFEKDGKKIKKNASLQYDKQENKISFVFEKRITDINCPVCGKKMIKLSWGYSCGGYEDNTCDFSLGKIKGKLIPEKEAQKLFTEGKTSLINGWKFEKDGVTYESSAYLCFDKQTRNIKFEFPKTSVEATDIECPVCGNKLNRYEKCLKCSDKGCSFILSNTIGGQKLSEENMLSLMNGDTLRMRNLINKKGVRYNADISLEIENGESKLKYEFFE